MKFSITIPAYKSQFLDEAIRSVLCQSYADWELIIVDDCSPEDLETIVRPYLSDKRINYYRNEKNCGAVHVVDNWNKCLSHCMGDYVICMGDDDRMLSCCLEEYSQLIEKYPHLNVYHCRTEIINEKGEVFCRQEPRPEWETALSLLWHRWADRDKQFIGDFCYQTTYLKQNGGYYKLPLAWGSDDVTSFLAAKEKGIANTQVFCFQYRENALTISNSSVYARIKLETQINMYQWYQQQLTSLATSPLSASDKRLLETINTARAKYYTKTIGRNCVDYIEGSLSRLAYCYRTLRLFHFPKWRFLKWYVSSIYYLLKRDIS